jgi:hypothetical protein
MLYEPGGAKGYAATDSIDVLPALGVRETLARVSDAFKPSDEQ